MNTANYQVCVAFALRQKNIAGESLADTSLRVYRRQMANPQSAFLALRKGGIVIPTVKSTLFDAKTDGTTATVILRANQVTDRVSLFNPLDGQPHYYAITDFIRAWEDCGGECTTAFPPSPDLYQPKPIDTAAVAVPHGFDSLLEALAESAHDAWALERQSEGWTYGPQRDDERLETPDMVPYGLLSESEKQYDRLMASQTIKQLIALGYTIKKK